MELTRGQTVIYPAHGACIVQRTTKIDVDGEAVEYVVLKTVLNEMTVSVPIKSLASVGLRPPVSGDELDDLIAVLSKPDPRVPANWSRRFKNHQEKLKSGDVYQVAEVVRNLFVRTDDAELSAAERTMYDRARVNLLSEIAPAIKGSTEDAEAVLQAALVSGIAHKTTGKRAALRKAQAPSV
jgi:CarD family transcriptional regulator